MNTGVKLAVLALVLVLLGCCGGTMLMLSPISASVEKREQQARGFGDTYTRQILKNWDAKVLTALLTKDYAAQFKLADFQETLDGNKKALGEFVNGKSTAALQKAVRNGDAQSLQVEYVNKATFKNGQASVKMSLVYESKRWWINSFAIEPY